jgi:hypothetical protein
MPNDTYVAPVIQPSGTTFAQFQTGGFSLIVDKLIAANAQVPNPTTPATVAVAGTTGLLAAGTYQVAYSFRDGFGETLVGGQSATFTVAAGQVATVTLPALPVNADEIWLYTTPVNNPTGPLSLYATGITSATYNMTQAGGSDPMVSPYTANTTGAATAAEKIRCLRRNNIENVFKSYSDSIMFWMSGSPIARKDARLSAQQWAGVFALWAQAAKECSSLILLNPGSLGYKYSPIGHAVPTRTWP